MKSLINLQRYNSPTRFRRDRSETPPHWKQASSKLHKLGTEAPSIEDRWIKGKIGQG